MQWDLSHAPLRNPRGEKVATMKARAEDEAKAQLQALEAQFYQQFNIPEEVLGRSEDTAAEGHGSVEAEDSTEGDEADDDNDNDEYTQTSTTSVCAVRNPLPQHPRAGCRTRCLG